MDKPLTLIVPTYNEHDNIEPLVTGIHEALGAYPYRILFIDDNSRDGTADLVRSLADRYPVEVIVRKDKRGLASAVVDGIAQARGEIIGVMDADLQHPPEVIPRLVGAIAKGAGVAVGSRYVPGGGCEGWSLTRRVISRGATVISHVFLPPTRGIKDPMSGLFMFRREVVQGVTLNPTGYKILLEVLMLGKYESVAEVPYVFRARSRGESKLSSKQQIEYLRHVYSLMRRTGELVRFMKFIVVGGSGVIVNLGLEWLLVEFGHLEPRFALPISIETSIINNFLFNNFFTFSDRRSRKLSSTLYSLLRFNVVSLAGLGINWLISTLFNDVFGVYYLAANGIGIVVAFLCNYILSNRFAWDAGKAHIKATRS